MPPLNLRCCPLTLALVGVLGCGSAARAELLKVSPFLGPQAAANAPTANAPLEYRGAMRIADTDEARVVDPARKVGTWLKVGERDANLDITLKQIDSARDTIVVDHGGQTLTLSMKAPKVVSGGAPMGMPMQPPPPVGLNVSPAVIQTVIPNPTPADEQRRLEAVAAEVARRRALREQAYQQAQNRPPSGQPAVSRQDMQQLQAPVPPVQRPSRTGR